MEIVKVIDGESEGRWTRSPYIPEEYLPDDAFIEIEYPDFVENSVERFILSNIVTGSFLQSKSVYNPEWFYYVRIPKEERTRFTCWGPVDMDKCFIVDRFLKPVEYKTVVDRYVFFPKIFVKVENVFNFKPEDCTAPEWNIFVKQNRDLTDIVRSAGDKVEDETALFPFLWSGTES